MPQDQSVFDHLPGELSYLIEPAQKYGIHQFDDDVDAFLSNATDSDLADLFSVAATVKANGHYEAVNTWLDEFEITDSNDAANLYFLFGLLDAADLEFE